MLKTSSDSVRHDAVPLDQVLTAAREWAAALLAYRRDVVRIGYFGSYATGRYGPGSDLDVLIEVTGSAMTFRDRPAEYRPDRFPVALELIVYTTGELARLRRERSALVATIESQFRPLP